MDLISSKAALCENIMEDPVHHSSPQNEPADHQSSSQNVNHSSPQNEPISNSRNMTRTARRHVSPKQTSGVFCRICHEGDFMESLLSPCSCSGSVGVVHRSCLEKWLSSSQYDTCELCRQPLTVTRRYRPVLQWLCQGENSGDDKRNLVTLHVWFCSPLLPLSPLFSALPAPRYMQAKARWWRRQVLSACARFSA